MQNRIATLALVVIAIGALHDSPALPAALAAALVTPALVDADLADHRLPNPLVAVCFAGSVVTIVLAAGTAGPDRSPTALLTGAAIGGVLLVFSAGGGLGMGDVKLGAALSLGVAVVDPSAAIGGIGLAFVIGGLCALTVIMTKGMVPTARIPFGPQLLAGYWICIVVT